MTQPMSDGRDAADDLIAFIDASPTPYHAVRESVRRLEAAGFVRLEEGEAWKLDPGARVYVTRGDASIAAFEIGSERPTRAGVRLIGAHTDSPNLRVKPHPELTRSGVHQLGVETYGGVLFHTWLDRDLSMAGRIVVKSDQLVARHLVDFRRPVLRIPSLAIHLNREVNTAGLLLNAQQHLVPLIGLESGGPFDLRTLLAEELAKGGVKVEPRDVLAWDLALYDAQAPRRIGIRDELVAAPRLDNLASCHAALCALVETTGARAATRGIVLWDHEECGSRSAQGADSPLLRTVLERIVGATSAGEPDAMARATARSFLISADMSHGVHPNYSDRHEPSHAPVLGRGPVIKSNVNQSYATDGESAATFEALCREADVTPQRFVTRTDLPCGSTIGPITAAQLGIRTVDVGNPMLSMHSAREMCAAADVGKMIAVMKVFFSRG